MSKRSDINYRNGKIYKLVALNAPVEEKVYVGSTTKEYLSQRFTAHRHNYSCYLNGKSSHMSSYKLFEKYGIENIAIVLLENVAVDTRDQLLAREKFYIQTLNCVNKQVPLRSRAEYRQDCVENEKIRHHNYYVNNKATIREIQSEKIDCACGSTIIKRHKLQHERSKKHIDFINDGCVIIRKRQPKIG